MVLCIWLLNISFSFYSHLFLDFLDPPLECVTFLISSTQSHSANWAYQLGSSMILFCSPKAKSQFKRRSTANNVEIHIPVPPDADSPKFKVWIS